jgi:hypothetical protein
MRELASLGTSIPAPALAACITAALCVRLGNQYGVSIAAQDPAVKVLKSVSKDRWTFYLNGRLSQDVLIISKLLSEKPRANWLAEIGSLGLEPSLISDPSVRALILATNQGNAQRVREIGSLMYSGAVGA